MALVGQVGNADASSDLGHGEWLGRRGKESEMCKGSNKDVSVCVCGPREEKCEEKKGLIERVVEMEDVDGER